MPDDTIDTELEQVNTRRLVFFFQDRVFPVLRRLEDRYVKYPKAFISGELLESFLWLHHGVEIGYFPIAQSRRFMYEHFRRFLQAMEDMSSSEYFRTWFTPPLQAILASEFTGRRELFSSGRTWKTANVPSDVDSLFQQRFVLANSFAQNPKVRPLLQAMATVSDSTWEGVIRNNYVVVEVERPGVAPLREIEKPNWTHAAFFACLDYMQVFRRLNTSFWETFPYANQELQDYFRKVKETHQWRLNFGYPLYRNRFIQVATIAAEAYMQFLPQSKEVDLKSAMQDFIRQLLELMTDWGAPIARTAGA